MSARKTKKQKALELLRDNESMSIAEASRRARLADSASVRKYLAANGGISEWRTSGCVIK